MSNPDSIEKAVSEWRAKYQIDEQDPLIAALDLVKIYLRFHEQPSAESSEKQPSYYEFRETVRLLDSSANAASELTKALIEEFRLATERFKSSQPETAIGLVLVSALSLSAGFFICLLSL